MRTAQKSDQECCLTVKQKQKRERREKNSDDVVTRKLFIDF